MSNQDLFNYVIGILHPNGFITPITNNGYSNECRLAHCKSDALADLQYEKERYKFDATSMKLFKLVEVTNE